MVRAKIVVLFLTCFVAGCKREVCTIRSAINSGQEGECLFANKLVEGDYLCKVTLDGSSPAVPNDDFTLAVRTYIGCGTSEKLGVNLNAYSSLSINRCVLLTGYSFTIPDSLNIYYGVNRIRGEGIFAGNNIYFEGTITRTGFEYPFKFQSFR